MKLSIQPKKKQNRNINVEKLRNEKIQRELTN